MIKNYFKVAFRYLLKNKRYSLINISGLALGFFCFLLLNFYVSSEKSFDKDVKNVFRLLQQEDADGKVRQMANIGPRVGTASDEQFPEIEAVTQSMVLGRVTTGNNPANRQYERMTTIDSSFFTVFNFKFIEGTPQTAFTQANGLVLTKELAKKYFGNASALNKTLFTNIGDGIVSGVIEDFPVNTHFEADLLVPEQTAATSFNWWAEFTQSNWHRNSSVTYFKIRPGTDISALEKKITGLAKDNWPKDVKFQSEFLLQPVQDIHLYSGEAQGEINKSKGDAFYVKIFFWIAIVILLVACFNYTGLLNVAYLNRAREIGVRKVVGAGKMQLIWQFFFESIFLTSIALALALAALQLTKPFIINLLGTSFSWSFLSANQILLLIGAGLLISLLSVAYPTYLISRLAPVQALKEQQKKKHSFSLQKAVLTFQFIASITLIACTVLFYRQVKYMQTKEMGFDSEGMVVVDINSGALRSKFEAIKTAFKAIPEVQNVSVTSRVPGEWKDFPVVGVVAPGQKTEDPKQMIFVCADEDFVPTYDLKLYAGTNFSGTPTDSSKIMINKAAAEALGLKEPVGQFVEIPTVNWGGDNNPFETPFIAKVIGIVDDFHFEDSHLPIRPMVIGFRKNPIHNIDYYSIKVKTASWAKTFASLKKVNDTFDPDNPIEYNILNDQFQRFYESDILRSRLLILFTGIIIFISCMGLFAITAYVLKHRTKEIGIRKVLGATISDLVKLISKDFVVLVLLGALIAIPLSWVIMSSWLQEFAYRLPVPWFLFALAALITLIIAFMTVSFQTIKTSLANPVNSLRTE